MALKLYSDGEVENSAQLSFEVYKSTSDIFTKLQAVNFLTSSLNKVEHNPRLVELCNEGIGLSEKLGRDDIKSTYMALKAECLMHRCSVLYYKMSNLKIAPGWMGFSTELEKVEYDKLLSKKLDYEKELKSLIASAIKIAENTSDKLILARVLRSQALIYGTRGTMLALYGIRYSKLYVFFFNNFRIRLYFLLKNKKEINDLINKCRNSFLKAIEITKSSNNTQECAYLLFSLIMEMNVLGRAREAKKYLKEAEKISRELGEKILIKQTSILRKSINEKIPKEYSKPPVFKGEDY